MPSSSEHGLALQSSSLTSRLRGSRVLVCGKVLVCHQLELPNLLLHFYPLSQLMRFSALAYPHTSRLPVVKDNFIGSLIGDMELEVPVPVQRSRDQWCQGAGCWVEMFSLELEGRECAIPSSPPENKLRIDLKDGGSTSGKQQLAHSRQSMDSSKDRPTDAECPSNSDPKMVPKQPRAN